MSSLVNDCFFYSHTDNHPVHHAQEVVDHVTVPLRINLTKTAVKSRFDRGVTAVILRFDEVKPR